MDYPLSFDCIKRRFQIRVGEGAVVVMPQDRFKSMLMLFLELVPVDEEWYKATYPDVAEGISTGSISSAKEHYVRYGYFENRLPHAAAIDEGWYLSTNSDVADGIANGGLAPTAHYQEHGYREGRWPVRPPSYLE